MTATTERPTGITLKTLAPQRRWVVWRGENKIPYDPNSEQHARIPTDPTTWGTRREAEHRWAALDNGRQRGGIGIVLGALDGGDVLMGFDLDNCISDDATLADWAVAVIDRFDTYVETSPSGHGVKGFF